MEGWPPWIPQSRSGCFRMRMTLRSRTTTMEMTTLCSELRPMLLCWIRTGGGGAGMGEDKREI
jgi:hypothetical protein